VYLLKFGECCETINIEVRYQITEKQGLIA